MKYFYLPCLGLGFVSSNDIMLRLARGYMIRIVQDWLGEKENFENFEDVREDVLYGHRYWVIMTEEVCSCKGLLRPLLLHVNDD